MYKFEDDSLLGYCAVQYRKVFRRVRDAYCLHQGPQYTNSAGMSEMFANYSSLMIICSLFNDYLTTLFQ
jgi:hypothetical protein